MDHKGILCALYNIARFIWKQSAQPVMPSANWPIMLGQKGWRNKSLGSHPSVLPVYWRPFQIRRHRVPSPDHRHVFFKHGSSQEVALFDYSLAASICSHLSLSPREQKIESPDFWEEDSSKKFFVHCSLLISVCPENSTNYQRALQKMHYPGSRGPSGGRDFCSAHSLSTPISPSNPWWPFKVLNIYILLESKQFDACIKQAPEVHLAVWERSCSEWTRHVSFKSVASHIFKREYWLISWHALHLPCYEAKMRLPGRKEALKPALWHRHNKQLRLPAPISDSNSVTGNSEVPP